MKQIISIFTFVFCLIQSFAQSSIWTEDFEGAWMKAMNGNKLVFVYTYNSNKLGYGEIGYSSVSAITRKLDNFLKSEEFEDYAKDNFCCVSVPIIYKDHRSFSVDKYDINKINFQSEKFADVHKKVFETSKISPVGSNIIIYNTGTNKKLVYSPYRSERRGQKDDVYMRSIEKMRSDLLGINSNVNEEKKSVVSADLKLTDGYVNDFNDASDYAKANNMNILIVSRSAAQKFTSYKHEFVQKNCLLLYARGSTLADHTIFLCSADYRKYLPLPLSDNFIDDLAIAMEKLNDPNYPSFHENNIAYRNAERKNYTDFDKAVYEAKSKSKLLYISATSRTAKNLASLSNTITTKMNMIFLDIKAAEICPFNSGKGLYLAINERLAEVMSCLGGVRFSGDIIYDPVSRKYCTISMGVDNLKEKIEIAAAEFKNPYSTKAKFLWPSDEVDEDTEYLTHNFSKALQQAKESNKKLLIIFTSAVKEYISGNIASWALDAKKKYDKAGVICVIIPTYVSSTPTIMPCKYQSLYEKFPEVFKLGKGFFGRLYDPQTGRAVPIQTRSDSVENMLKLIEAGKAELANPDSELAFKVEGLPTNKGVK